MVNSRRIVLTLLVVALVGVPAGWTRAGVLDPTGYTSQGTLNLAPGTYTFNTAISGAPILTTYNLVGGTYYPGATVATGVYSNGIAVFDFNSITIGSGVNIMSSIMDTMPGNSSTYAIGAPIALLSRSFETINGTIDVSGTSSNNITRYTLNVGGPGSGSLAQGQSGTSGTSYNGFSYTSVASGGGGGGFGGVGGTGQGNLALSQSGSFTPVLGGAGGSGQFNLASVLQGGSYGGMGGSGGYLVGAPGAGGGAIELAAVGDLSIGGSILANGTTAGFGPSGGGGGSGGGSGGGIFLYGNTVENTGSIYASGGLGAPGLSGGITTGGGGGGGGGIVLVESVAGFTNTGAVNVNGGGGASVSGGGSVGQFIVVAVVPEPSSLLMLTTAAFGLAGVAVIRCKSSR